jgi:signal-transduction protein with cAMP-binding, CBS, and nucleotidyltransferase domain
VITTRDIVVRAIANDKDPRTTPVAEIMTTDFACCNENDGIADALDTPKRIAGIVSRHDIFAARNGISSSDLADTDS